MFNNRNRPNNALSTWVEPISTQLLCATGMIKGTKKIQQRRKRQLLVLQLSKGFIYLAVVRKIARRFPLLPSASVQLNTPYWPLYTNTKHQSCIATSLAIQMLFTCLYVIARSLNQSTCKFSYSSQTLLHAFKQKKCKLSI